jgi:hypothetical protein
MSRPLPRPVGKKPRPPAKKKSGAILSAGVVGSVGVAGVSAGLLLFGAFRTRIERKPVPRTGAEARKVIDSELESGNKWFLEEVDSQLPRVKKLLDEADHGGARPTHFKQKTGLIEINLRGIVTLDEPAPDGKPKKKPELESSEAVRVPEKPQPPPTDKRGKVISDEKGAEGAQPEVPVGPVEPEGEVAE